MKRLKVMTIVGTRPEIIKLSRVIAELEKFTQHVLVHTGQNFDYELNAIFFDDLNIKKPDYFLEAAQGSAAQTIGLSIAKTDDVLLKEQPDAVLIYGDTNSCLSVIAAKRRKIPIFHMEAGNRCFDERVPEEINRRMIDHISDINLTLSEHARRYLLREGVSAHKVIKVGSSMKEIYQYYEEKIAHSTILSQLSLNKRHYFVASIHREENVDNENHLKRLLDALNTLTKKYNMPIVVSTHPRTRLRLEALNESMPNLKIDPNIRFLKPFGFFDYYHLMKNAFCVLSDSGSLTEDASIMNFPAVTLRETHERPEGMDVGTLLMTGLNKDRILQTIDIAVNHFVEGKRTFPLISDYDVDNVSKKVVRIIHSYVDYINATTWLKAKEPFYCNDSESFEAV
ncbi:MAG: non-hydrolyzing UDP-N-acetylglucosamine 2-epimerase [Gammaproteobacteria bacterium]